MLLKANALNEARLTKLVSSKVLESHHLRHELGIRTFLNNLSKSCRTAFFLESIAGSEDDGIVYVGHISGQEMTFNKRRLLCLFRHPISNSSICAPVPMTSSRVSAYHYHDYPKKTPKYVCFSGAYQRL
jgi:hypothetical protein